MKRHLLLVESLEKRQLFDADNCLLETPESPEMSVQGDLAEFAIARSSNELGNDVMPTSHGEIVDSALPTSIAYSGSQVIRSGSTVATVTTVDSSGKQRLWIVREDGAEIAFQVDLGNMFVESLLVDGDRLLVIGYDRRPNPWLADSSSGTTGLPYNHDVRVPWFPAKQVLAVDLSSGEVAGEVALAPGFLRHATFVDGQAVFVLNRYDLVVPAIWPPIETYDEVFRFDWDETGLGEARQDRIPRGLITSVVGDRIVVATQTFSGTVGESFFPSSIELRSFKLTDDGIEAEGSIDIGPGYIDSLRIDSSGERAVVIRSQYSLALDAQRKPSEVLIIDLKGETPALIDTVVVETRSLVLSQDDDYVLFYGNAAGSLIIVNLLDGAQGNSRISTVTLPENLSIRSQVNRLSGNRLVMVGVEGVFSDDRFAVTPGSLPFYYAAPNTLVTLSLADASIDVHKIAGIDRIRSMHVIDASTDRLGFQVESVDASGVFSNSFVFGELNSEGQFVRQGEIKPANPYGYFYVDKNKLTIATQLELTAYEYSNPATPLYQITLIDEDAPPLTAVNDQAVVFLRESDEDWFGPELVNLLANDQIPFSSSGRTRIVELIDAPDGISIIGDQYIGVGSDAFTVGQVIEFRYRISDGVRESEATVTLTIEKSPDDVEQGLPIVELALAATSLAGERLNVIEPGESFWLELRGKDLRSFGQGLFSAFFSLETTDAITFDGTVEAGDGFTLVQADRLSEKVSGSSIRGLGVIDADGVSSSSRPNQSEVLIRVRATANRVGALVLMPLPSRDVTQETSVFGSNEALSESQINRLALTLPIVDDAPPDPADVDGNGSVEALDALRVINMISRYGTGTVEAITTKMNEGSSAGAVSARAANAAPVDGRRFDVNGSGTITPLDALVIINEMSRRRRLNAVSPEASSGSVTTGASMVLSSGGGVLMLSGSNAYTGTTTVNAGVLELNSTAIQLGARQSPPAHLDALKLTQLNGLNFPLTSSDEIEEKRRQDERDAIV